MDGLVVANYGSTSLVEDRQGQFSLCTSRKSTGRIVCGDRVTWRSTGNAEGVIEKRLDRRTVLQRHDSNGKSRPLAANIDQVIVVSAPEPPLDRYLIDRYLAAAEIISATPSLVINKMDLLDPEGIRLMQERIREYREIGYQVSFTCALSGKGVEELSGRLKVGILVGQSGVGKSSLIKRLLPDRDIAVGTLSDASGLGRHTTTTTTLYHLPGGGDLIDSPGVRDFRLRDVDPVALAHAFRDFRPFLGQCRFHNCRHDREPGCALSIAARNCEINSRRLKSYRNILHS